MNRSNSHSMLEGALEASRTHITEPLADKAERLKKALGDTVDDQMKMARRAAKRSRAYADDLTDGVRLRTRRQPLAALGIAIGVGALVGIMLTWRKGSRRG
jgi:hypothetical protein